MTFKITINGIDISSHVAMPIKFNALLDERLDESRLSLRHTDVKIYDIGAVVEIEITNLDQSVVTRHYIVSADDSVEIPAGSGFYDHELSIIESTKLLEGSVTESLTFSNDLKHIYDNTEASPAHASSQIKDDLLPYASDWLHRTIATGTLYIPELGSLIKFKNYTGQYKIQIYALVYRYDDTEFDEKLSIINNDYQDPYYIEPIPIQITEPGMYRIHLQWSSSDATYRFSESYIDYYFQCADNINPLPKWTIASVIDRVLDLETPHRVSVPPRFHLDPAQREMLAAIESPEFAFTGLTLKGILDQIGGFIHGVPRLIKGESGKLDTIHFDMLGGINPCRIGDERYISEMRSQNIEDYATELDSTVENLVNTLDAGEGAIVEPYKRGFKTVRSEEQYARITDGNMVIETSLPIYSVQKLEVITKDNEVKDITAYVFEGAEYGRFSSFNGNFPTSKAYAIYYTLGEKNIRGLNYKSPTVRGGADSKYSIANIISAATDRAWNISAGWWSDVITNGKTKSGTYPTLAFRITYTPIFSARVLQHKPFIEKGALKRTLMYNQTANLVETRYYGENMKGAIARMGNPELVRTYRMRDLSLMPDIGDVWEHEGFEYYVASVTVQAYHDFADIMVGYSRDFNRLSEYIGINSEWRAYEVSERKAYNRDMVYRDFCVIGDSITPDKLHLFSPGNYYLLNTFLQSNIGISGENMLALTVASVTTYDEQGNDYNVTLPVTSAAMGNTLVFNFNMADNYSAGAKSVYDGNGDITGYWQTDVPYSDYYGRAETLNFELSVYGEEVKYNDSVGFLLPQGSHSNSPAKISTVLDRVKLSKNGSEILRMSYQVAFVSNWNDLIIGPAMTRNNPMVSGRKEGHAAKLFILPSKVGRFDTCINMDSATSVITLTDEIVTSGRNDVQFYPTKAQSDGVAWAIADGATGEILLARNVSIKAGEELNLPYLNITHELP
ncbi:MAG: hypothetical protein J1G01_04565 [Clostridiales bacterium]|nr:hypothetical protein [Clostridiales bacterium]